MSSAQIIHEHATPAYLVARLQGKSPEEAAKDGASYVEAVRRG